MHAKSLSTVYKYLSEGERIKTMHSGQLLYDCYEKNTMISQSAKSKSKLGDSRYC